MTNIEEDEPHKTTPLKRFQEIVLSTALFASPTVSIACAIMVGYFTYWTINRPPPADVSALAISILKSDNASPEMRDWATAALGLQPYMPIHRRVTN